MSDKDEKQRLRRRFAERLGKVYAANSPLSEWLTLFLNFLPDLTHTEAINGLLALRKTFTALQEKDPGACAVVVGLLARKLGLSRRDVEAALGLHPQHDLDQQLFAALRGLAGEVRHGLLFVYQVVAWVNANRAEHEALTNTFVAARLRELGFDFARHRPSRLVWMPSLVFPPEDTVTGPLLLPAEEP